MTDGADDVEESSGRAPEAEQPLQKIDTQLLAESKLYDVPYKVYLSMTVRERGGVKAKWGRALRVEAKRRGLDSDEFVAMTEEARNRARDEYPMEPVVKPKKPRTIEDVVTTHTRVADYVDEDLQRESHSQESAVPATEANPEKRDKPTLGEIRPADNEDLVGWDAPKNLRDIFPRYTIGDGQHFVRVERIEPRQWQQIPCSGYLGEIRDQITEEEFQAFYGGRIYELQVYGPDTRGRRDAATGLPLIKPKTQPFRYTVPILPPNLAVLPGTSPKKKSGDTMHPFSSMFTPQVLPTTAADAQMHKSTLDFVTHALERSEADRRELRQALSSSGSPNADVLKVVTSTSEEASKRTEKAFEAREQLLREELKETRTQLRELGDEMKRRDAMPRESPVKDTVELMKVANPTQNAEQQMARQAQAHTEEVLRIKESHREAMETLRGSNKEALENMKARQDDELKRIRERTDDLERNYRTKIDEEEKRGRERERELKEQMEAIRRDERALSDQRVKDTEKRFEDRIADMKTAHTAQLQDLRDQNQRELRMQTEQHQTRVETTKNTYEFQITSQKDRVKRLEEELAEAKEEASAAGDPVAIMERQEKLSKALGWEKKENDGPQTAGERFAATVGVGLSKALEDLPNWVPKVVETVRRTPQPQAALGGPPTAAAPGRPRQVRPGGGPGARRQVAWATQSSIPIADHEPVIPPPAPEPQPQQQAAPPPAPPPGPPADAAPPPYAEPPPAPPSNGATNKLSAIFPDNVIGAFRTEVERCIDGGMPAEEFARRFLQTYPEPAIALVEHYKAEDLIDVVKAMPNGAESNILRRDGKRWVEKLWESIAKGAQAAAAAPVPPPPQ